MNNDRFQFVLETGEIKSLAKVKDIVGFNMIEMRWHFRVARKNKYPVNHIVQTSTGHVALYDTHTPGMDFGEVYVDHLEHISSADLCMRTLILEFDLEDYAELMRRGEIEGLTPDDFAHSIIRDYLTPADSNDDDEPDSDIRRADWWKRKEGDSSFEAED